MRYVVSAAFGACMGAIAASVDVLSTAWWLVIVAFVLYFVRAFMGATP